MSILTISETVRPSVWVGCLACFNEDCLVGNWLNAEDAEFKTLRISEKPDTFQITSSGSAEADFGEAGQTGNIFRAHRSRGFSFLFCPRCY